MDVRICARCGIEKRLSSFKKHKNFPNRLPTCRKCYDTNHLTEVKRTKEQIESQRAKMIGKKLGVKHRLAISRGQKKCVENGTHPFLVHGIDYKESDRHRIEYKIWKEKLLEKIGSKCEECGSNNMLHAHHIKCFYEFPELRFDVDNGKILCVSCHAKLHWKIGKRRNISRQMTQQIK